MAESAEFVRREIGEGVALYSQTLKGPPYVYRYYVESVSFKKIAFTFKFDGSENFALRESETETAIDPSKPLQATVVALPFEKSGIVSIGQVDEDKGGSLSMAMSWLIEEPDADSAKNYMAAYNSKISDLMKAAKTLFPASVVEESRAEIEERCTGFNASFIDITFPPVDDALYAVDPAKPQPRVVGAKKGKKKPLLVWRRPTEFFGGAGEAKTFYLFDGPIEPGDIKQGALGDCWLMCSLAAIAEFPALVTEIFCEDCREHSPFGVYKVRLCKDGMWTIITLDDYFPCKPEGGPVYSRAHGEELWVMLLEKAFAKINGSYAQIRGGWAFEAMIDLTGAPFHDLRFDSPEVAARIASGNLWDTLLAYDAKSYIMTLSTPGTDTFTEGGGKPGGAEGLVPGHAYTLMAVKLAENHKLCKIRNPWGSLEWTGDWSDHSPLWTPELKEELGWADSDDGIFWMSFEDMLSHFTGVNICLVRHPGLNAHPWHESRTPFEYKFSKTGRGVTNVPLFSFKVLNEESEVYISVHQKDKRGIGNPAYTDIGATVLKVKDDGSYEHLASSGNSAERQHQFEIHALAPGSYIVVPTSTGCKMEAYKEDAAAAGKVLSESDYLRSAVMVFHSSEPIEVDTLPFNSAAFEAAMDLPIIEGGTPTDLFGDGSVVVYTRKCGYAGISYVAKNIDEKEALSLQMDFSGSQNVLSHRGLLKADVVIPPNGYVAVQHLMPKDDEKGWSVGWACNARWLTAEEYQEISEKDVEIQIE